MRFDSCSAVCPTAGRMSFRFEAGPAACPIAGAYHFGSRRARRLARRLARVASADGSVETGLVYCPMARSYRFGSRRAWRLAHIASADGLDRGGPGILPDGSRAALRRMVWSRRARCPAAHSHRFSSRRARRLARWLARIASADGSGRGGPGGLPDSSLVSLRRMVRDGPSVLPDVLARGASAGDSR